MKRNSTQVSFPNRASAYFQDGGRRKFELDISVVVRNDGGNELRGACAVEKHFLLSDKISTWSGGKVQKNIREDASLKWRWNL